MSRLGWRIGIAVFAAVVLTLATVISVDIISLRRQQEMLPAVVRPTGLITGWLRNDSRAVSFSWPVEIQPNGTAGRFFAAQASAVRFEPDGSLSFTFGQLRDLLQDVLSRRLSGLLASAAVALTGGLLLALWLGRRIAVPIERVSAAAAKVSQGDLSARVELPRGLANSNEEHVRLARDFNAMAGNLERLERERGEMIADIAHELRTPLTIMRGRLEALEDGVAPLEMAEVKNLHVQTLLLGRLVDDLRTLVQLDSGRLVARKSAVDLAEVAASAVQVFQGQAETAGVELRLAGPTKLLAELDETRIRQVLGNLIDNALRYTPTGGEVTVQLGSAGSVATIEVTDSGPGIPEHHLEKVFERFYRVERSRDRASGGSGLGLAIVRALVELHGGRVRVANRFDALGARFTVELPLASAQPA